MSGTVRRRRRARGTRRAPRGRSPPGGGAPPRSTPRPMSCRRRGRSSSRARWPCWSVPRRRRRRRREPADRRAAARAPLPRRQPLAGEQLVEHRPGEARLTFVQVAAVVRVRYAGAGPEGVEHRIDRPATGDDERPQRRNAVEARIVDECLVVARRKRVSTHSRIGAGRLQVEDRARGLLLEPLPHVALVQARRLRELRGSRRAALRERAVQPEPVADVDGEHVPGRRPLP